MSVDHLAPSRLADRYVLRDLIAVGGMGEVYLATDERLARQVAVKVLSRALTDSPESVERFRREALAAAGLSHPNIARVYDYGVDGENHFIVMEHLAGQSLDRVIRDRGRLSSDQAVDITCQVCDALAAAHSAGIVHRDIKPGNVIVTPDGTVKVTDFGISKALGSAALTDAGTVLGTAAYLPPEVGLGKPAGPASDLYSLGIVLYQMVTGQVPFSGGTAVTVALKHISGDVPAPSAIDPGVPRFLDRVVATATSLRPEDRFPSADAMAAALRAGDAASLGETRAMAPVLFPTQAMGPVQPPTEAMPQHQPATRAMAAVQPATQAMPQTQVVPRSTVPAGPPAHALVSGESGRASLTAARPRAGRLAWILGALVVALAIALGVSLLVGGATNQQTATPPATTPSAGTSSTASPTSTTPGSARSGMVPDGLVGSDLASAVQAIKAAGLSYEWRMVASDAPRNQVLKATPAAGTTLQSGDAVQLVISRGPATDTSATSASTTGNSGKGHGKDKGKGN